MRYKKLTVFLLLVFLLIPHFSFFAYAAENESNELPILEAPPLYDIEPYAAPTDWTNSPPYKEDFLAPAGEDSIVYEVFNDKGEKRLVVFPSGAVVAHLVESGNKKMAFMWTGDGDPQPIFVYPPLSDGSYSVSYYATVPSSSLSVPSGNPPAYLGGWPVYDWDVTGFITNQTFDNISNAPQGKKLAFHSKQAAAEKETQGMISKLTDSIKDWFSNLINKMGEFFSGLADKISGFFQGLADSIGEFFTKLWNKIWWGNENGEADYEPPDVSSKFDEVTDKLDEWLSKVTGFSDSLNQQGAEVAGYVSQGSSFVDKFISYCPPIILVFLTFAIIFVVVRKVVGR